MQIKENAKALRHWPLCGEFTGDQWIPYTNGQQRGNVSIWWRHPGMTMLVLWHGNPFCITNVSSLPGESITSGFPDKGPGVGVTKPISSVPLFSEILVMSEETLAIEYHVYIWQVSPQLSCGDICQIWMWFEESNMYFSHIENFVYGEINERSFSNPHPRYVDH